MSMSHDNTDVIQLLRAVVSELDSITSRIGQSNPADELQADTKAASSNDEVKQSLGELKRKLEACITTIVDPPPDISMEEASVVLAGKHLRMNADAYAAAGDEVGQWLQETFTTRKVKKSAASPSNQSGDDGKALIELAPERGSMNGHRTLITSSTRDNTPSTSMSAMPPDMRFETPPPSNEASVRKNSGFGETVDSRRISLATGAGEGDSEEDSRSPLGSTPTADPNRSPNTNLSSSQIAAKYNRSTLGNRNRSTRNLGLHRLLTRFDLPWLDVDSPDFDIFSAIESYGDDNIFVLVCANVLFRYSFVEALDLDVEQLMLFLSAVQSNYRHENPYHNHIHGADVLQTTHVYLCVGDVKENFDDAELLSVLFSALVHDVGHLGVSNNYLIKTNHPLASLYNDNSPLESMHASLAFAILQQHNFFESSSVWDEKAMADFRSRVVDIVVGTDMKFHNTMINTVADILADGQIDDDEVTYLFKSIVHAADLSNPMKPAPIYRNWLNRVMAEFWQQGDLERKRGMPISVMCDRNNCTIPKAQVGFITFIVKPFIQELATLLPDVWVNRLQSNLELMSSWGDQYDITEIEHFASVEWKDTWETNRLRQEVASTARQPKMTRLQRVEHVFIQRLHKLLLNESQRLLNNDSPVSLMDVGDASMHFALNIWTMVAETEFEEPQLGLADAFPDLFMGRKHSSSSAASTRSGQSGQQSPTEKSFFGHKVRFTRQKLTRTASKDVMETSFNPLIGTAIGTQNKDMQLKIALSVTDRLLAQFGSSPSNSMNSSTGRNSPIPATEPNPIQAAVVDVFRLWNIVKQSAVGRTRHSIVPLLGSQVSSHPNSPTNQRRAIDSDLPPVRSSSVPLGSDSTHPRQESSAEWSEKGERRAQTVQDFRPPDQRPAGDDRSSSSTDDDVVGRVLPNVVVKKRPPKSNKRLSSLDTVKVTGYEPHHQQQHAIVSDHPKQLPSVQSRPVTKILGRTPSPGPEERPIPSSHFAPYSLNRVRNFPAPSNRRF